MVFRLETDLNRAWAKDERVSSLKIAIQMAKLLADTNMPQYYPIMFVTVTNALEKFASMVFNRLKNKAEEGLNEKTSGASRLTCLLFIGHPRPPPIIAGKAPSGGIISLPDDFTSDDVPASAKETTRNWFYKTACIRELLPRVYIEMTLLR